MSKINAAILIEKYIEIRDFLSSERRKWNELEENLKSDLNKIEAAILRFQDQIGTESISSKLGTAFRVKKERYQMGNWDKFIAYVVKTKNYQMLEKRVAKNATKEVLENEIDRSPEEIGVKYSSEYTIQIRRK
jgi:DNA-directed RNA polymerase delta subunit